MIRGYAAHVIIIDEVSDFQPLVKHITRAVRGTNAPPVDLVVPIAPAQSFPTPAPIPYQRVPYPIPRGEWWRR